MTDTLQEDLTAAIHTAYRASDEEATASAPEAVPAPQAAQPIAEAKQSPAQPGPDDLTDAEAEKSPREETVGKRIRARRKALRVSAEALARAVGISPATIYRYESGEIAKVPSNVLRDIAEALGVTAEALLGHPEQTEEDAGLAPVYFRLAKEAQQAHIDPADIALAIKTIKEIRDGLKK